MSAPLKDTTDKLVEAAEAAAKETKVEQEHDLLDGLVQRFLAVSEADAKGSADAKSSAEVKASVDEKSGTETTASVRASASALDSARVYRIRPIYFDDLQPATLKAVEKIHAEMVDQPINYHQVATGKDFKGSQYGLVCNMGKPAVFASDSGRSRVESDVLVYIGVQLEDPKVGKFFVPAYKIKKRRGFTFNLEVRSPTADLPVQIACSVVDVSNCASFSRKPLLDFINGEEKPQASGVFFMNMNRDTPHFKCLPVQEFEHPKPKPKVKGAGKA